LTEADAFPGSVESELRSKSRVEGARKKTKKITGSAGTFPQEKHGAAACTKPIIAVPKPRMLKGTVATGNRCEWAFVVNGWG
jgi:hypothetical protein